MVNHRADMLRLWNEKKPVVRSKDVPARKLRPGETLTFVLTRHSQQSFRTFSVTQRLEQDGVVVERRVIASANTIATFIDPMETTLRSILKSMSEETA